MTELPRFWYSGAVFFTQPHAFPYNGWDGDIMQTIKKAAVILPGIMGSRLFAGENIYEDRKLKHNRDKLLWINAPDIYEFLKPTWSIRKRTQKITAGFGKILSGSKRIDALRCHPNGASVHRIVTSGLDDTPPCDCFTNICRDTNTHRYGTAGIYTNLVTSLKKHLGAENAVFLSYDWRKPITKAAAEIASTLDSIAKRYDEVYLIAHSLGGLVACQYLSTTLLSQKFKLITIGTPFMGAPKALRILLTGNALPAHFMHNAIQKTAHNISSVYELMPSRLYTENFPFIKLIRKRTIRSVTLNALETLAYLKTAGLNIALYAQAQNFHAGHNFTSLFNESGNAFAVVGDGIKTETSITVSEKQHFIYYPTTTKKGDGTVPTTSATMNGQINNDRIFYVKESHSDLPSNKKVVNLVKSKIDNWF